MDSPLPHGKCTPHQLHVAKVLSFQAADVPPSECMTQLIPPFFCVCVCLACLHFLSPQSAQFQSHTGCGLGVLSRMQNILKVVCSLCVWVLRHVSVQVELGGELAVVSCFLTPGTSWESNSGCQIWQQMPLPTEASCWPQPLAFPLTLSPRQSGFPF